MKELEEQMKKENEAQRRASKGKGSSNSRPPGFSSPPSR
tara:strand:- start:1279 stop:1395 length:117 start_codon:yes stop_codon:yes gene_type:complete